MKPGRPDFWPGGALYSELPCESEARLAAMAAEDSSASHRWTINPHFVTATFWVEPPFNPFSGKIETLYIFDIVGTWTVQRNYQTRLYTEPDMRTC